MGAKPRSFGNTEGLTLAGDNKVDLKNPLTTKTGGTSGMNQIVVGKKVLAMSPNGATMRAVVDEGTSLLDTGAYDKIADCLGDVVVAIIVTPQRSDAAKVLAVGVRDPAAATSKKQEVLCALPTGGNQATVHRALKSSMALSAVDPLANRPLSTIISKSTVTDQGKLVRAVLTLRATSPVGLLICGLSGGLASHWLGA